jgi:hypothetical protein
MKLRFHENDVRRIAARYEYFGSDTVLVKLRPKVLARGWLQLRELERLAKWKSPRSAGHIKTNSDSYIKEITRFAFSVSTERATIEALTLLDGVQWPTASVILHFFHRDRYPILDYRALWSVSLEVPQYYCFEFLVAICRALP